MSKRNFLYEIAMINATLGINVDYSPLNKSQDNYERRPQKAFDEHDKERLAKAQEKRARRYANRKELKR